MRGMDQRTGTLFSYVDIEARVPAVHPLRRIRELVNTALARLDKSFTKWFRAVPYLLGTRQTRRAWR
jgi:hypothetical protein